MKRSFALPALFFAACLTAVPATAEQGPGDSLPAAASLSGAFLAAETARAENDFDAAVKYYGEALSYDPDNPAIEQELLLALITNGDFHDAVPLAEKLQDSPDIDRLARVVLGVQAIRDKHYLQADGALILTNDNDLERLLTTIMRAWARFGGGETDYALELLDKLQGPDWYSLFTAYHGAMIADAAGLKQEAENRYLLGMDATAGGSASPQTYIRMAESFAGFLARSGEADRAKETINAALAIAPANPSLLALAAEDTGLADKALRITDPSRGAGEILYNMATAINRDGAEAFAALYLQMASILAPGTEEIDFELGGISERLKQNERAIAFYDRIPDNSPLSEAAQLQKGLNLADLDRNEEAKKILSTSIDEHPTEYRGYLALGGVYASQKEYEEAAAVYERAIANIDTSDPTFWPLYYRMGIAYERIKQWDKAEPAFKHALELSPNQPDVLNYLGYSWIDMNIHLDEGLEMIRKAVERRPQDGYIVDSLGWVYYRLGRFDEAVEELEKATDLRPRDAIINDHLGDAYWRVGRKLEATYQWSQALGMEIEPADAARIEEKLAAAQRPGGKPDIASSQADDGNKTAASPETKNGNGG